MSLRSCLFMLALVCSSISHAADLFNSQPTSQNDALRPEQDAHMKRIRGQRNTLSADAVGINLGALNGDNVTIDLPTARQLKAKVRKIERRGPRDFTWYGELAGVPGHATLVVRGNRVTGTIRHDTDLYRIVSTGEGSHVLVRIDEKAFPKDHPEQINDAGDVPPLARASAGPAAGTVIDVLVAYTPAAESKSGDIQGLIQLAVDETNEAYENSGIHPRIRLVHTHKASYKEGSKSYNTIMGHLVGTTDDKLREIHGLRDQYGADMVVLLIAQGDYCGQANAIMARQNSAFALVHWDCATGYYSFGHELAHLQGARHDPATDGSTTPFAYGHGYRYKQKWRTIMAYDCPNGCPRLPYFSNPTVLYQGIPMGSAAKNDNARVLNETAATVSIFRPTAP